MIDIDKGELADLWRDNKEPEFLAISYALKMAISRLKAMIDTSLVYAGIQNLQEDAVNELASELQVQYYDNDLPLSSKCELVINTLKWHSRAGTPSAVKELIQAVYGEGQLIEWFEDGGEPYTFKIRTNATITPTVVEDLDRMIVAVKNIRSHLEDVVIHRNIIGTVYVGGAGNRQAKVMITGGFSDGAGGASSTSYGSGSGPMGVGACMQMNKKIQIT